MTQTLYIIFGLIAVVAVWGIALYNGLVRTRQRVLEGESDIEVQQKRRYDLIPNLVETVKGYAAHERETLGRVTEARARAMSAHGTLQERQAAENQLSAVLKTLFAVAESYPDLKANTNFLHLQTELTDSEDKIQAARRFYNAMVRDFNTRVETFPSNLMARWFKFLPYEFFDLAEEAARQPVAVKF